MGRRDIDSARIPPPPDMSDPRWLVGTELPQAIYSGPPEPKPMSDAVKITWIICGTILVLAAMIILFRY